MRALVILSGAALLSIAIAYIFLTGALAIFTIPVAVVIIILGLKLTPSQKKIGAPAGGASNPLVVDRAILGASIYQLFFFDTRLILKRLATAKTTILAVVFLAIIGFFTDRLIGALAGAAAGYAMQEYTAQVGRAKPPISNSSIKVEAGDVEVPYEELEKVRLEGNRLVLFSKRGITKLGMSRGSGRSMSPLLKKLFDTKFEEESVHPPDTPRKKNQ